MPVTKLFMIRTTHCSHQMIRMDWGDGEPIVMMQMCVASPPRLPARFFDPNILPKR